MQTASSAARVGSGRRRGGNYTETDDDSPRSADSGGSLSAGDEDTEESMIRKRMERLANSLQDTGKNMRNVSGMLEEFKERDHDRGAAIDHLRMELLQSTDLLREERRKSIREREKLKQTSSFRGRSLSPRFARRAADLTGAANIGLNADPTLHHRPNRSVSPSMRRPASYRQYATGVPTIPLYLPTDLGVNGAGTNIEDLMPASDRSNGDLETRQLLQELVENQRNLLNARSQPPIVTANTYSNEADRISHLEQMLHKLQTDIKESKSSPKYTRGYENPDISEDLRKDLMSNQHATPQIRSPRASNQSRMSLPEDERQHSTEQSERNLKRKLIRSESAIAELEKQLDDAHRRLEGAEMGRNEVQRQVVEIREQLNRSEQERDVLRNRVNDYTHEIQREVAKREDSFQSEKRGLEEEIRRLKVQLNDPRRMTEFDSLKADVEKLEKTKTYMSSRLEDLQKKNQEKDIELTENSYKMREITNKLEDSDRVKKKAISRVDDLTRELNVLKIEREKMSEQLKNSESQLAQKTKDNEELTTKSKNIINALKAKVNKLTNDLEKSSNSHQANLDRINTLEREVESGRITAAAAAVAKDGHVIGGADSGQLAAIHKEIHDVMVMRGEQEDLMRRKNEEIHELRGELESLQRAHSSLKDDMDKMEEEITLNRKRMMETENIKDEQEDELIKLRSEADVTRDELNRATAKAEELTTQVDHLQKRLSEEVGDRDETKMALIQTEKKERLAREEISSLLIKLNEQEQMHHKIVNELKHDIQELVDVEQRNVQQMVNSMKSERNELETEIANLRVEVSNEKESSRGLREDKGRLERELEEASETSRKQAETEMSLSTRIEALQFEITIKDNLAQELESRIKKLERTLKGVKEKLRKEEQDMLNVMATVSRGVNALVDAAAGEGSLGRHKSAPISTSADPSGWLAEIKAKLSWLLTEVGSWYSKEKDVQAQLKRTQQDILTLLNNSNQDKSFFMDQLERQGSAIKHIASEKEDVRLGNIDHESRLLTLHHNVEDLSNRLHMEAEKDEFELNHKTPTSDAFSNGDYYYQPSLNRYGVCNGGPGYTARTEGVTTESTVTPEQSVVHYAPPFSFDFSGVPFHTITGGGGHMPHHSMVYPQSSSTPAPTAPTRMTHTPPTKHDSATVSNGQQGTGLLGSFQPISSVGNFNTKAPMSMTDEEFRASFLPRTPPVDHAFTSQMQPERETKVPQWNDV